jgi:hypothetical protein
MMSNRIITEKQLANRREQYAPDTRVELVYMNDAHTSLKPGDRGTVTHVDDIGTVFVDWDCGSRLGVAYGEDQIKLVPPIPDDVREQLTVIQKSGVVNMFSINEVQRLCFNSDFYAAVDWIECNRKHYGHFILTGKV